MKIKGLLFVVIILTITNSLIIAQQCENFDKGLFHMLPDTFPNRINCTDSNGLKQGWWIDYKVKYNPVDRPDELAKGSYVDNYSYGRYKNNLKIGNWISVANVHLIYETQRDNYYYSKDTIMITSKFTLGESTLYYNADSSIIESKSLCTNEKYPIYIECNKKNEKGRECKMKYRDHNIKEFSIDQFDLEFFGSFNEYKREKKIIDKEIDN